MLNSSSSLPNSSISSSHEMDMTHLQQTSSHTNSETFLASPITLSEGPFSSSTATSPTNSVSILSSVKPTPQNRQSSATMERLPRTSFIAQRMEFSEIPQILSPQSTVLVQEFPNGGPVREKLVEMIYSPLDSQQYLRFAGGRAIENFKGTLRYYGYPRDTHTIVEDVELNLVFPINRILERQQKISSHYEMYFKMLLNSLIFITIITLGCGLVFFPCLAMVQYLHWKHVRNYDKNVKQRVQRILDRENKKYLPYGFEWIVKYSIINTDKRTCVGVRTEMACVQEVVLSLIHIRSNSSTPTNRNSIICSTSDMDAIINKEAITTSTTSTPTVSNAISETNPSTQI